MSMFARVGLGLILVFFVLACMAGFFGALTSVADTGVVNLNAHLMRLGRSNLDVLDGEGLGGTPGDRSLSKFSIREVANVGVPPREAFARRHLHWRDRIELIELTLQVMVCHD